MDQNSFVEGQSQQSTTSPSTSTSQSQAAPVEHHQPAPVEKTLTQSEVNSLIGRTKAEAEEKGRQRALQEINTQNSTTQRASSPLIGGVTQDDIRRIAAEESKKQHEEIRRGFEQERAAKQGEKIINELFAKFEHSKEKYPDFEEKVAPYLNAQNARVLAITNQFDNSGDIVYELANRPSLIEDIDRAYDRGSPQEAHRRLMQLSESIKINKQAANLKTPNEPLSQIKSSPVSSDGGLKGVNYYRHLLAKKR